MIQPSFYPRFHCKAGACLNTCCQKWEIDIDEDTAWYYDEVEGPLGERIRGAILEDADGARFRLNEKGFCPLLRADGLCEIVCQLGEEALCDICALHPRFFADVGDDELAGLGLCCEAVCELLLETDEPLIFTDEESGGNLTLPQLMERLGFRVDQEELHADLSAPSEGFLDAMARTEAIDAAWPEEFTRLRADLQAKPPILPQGGRYDRVFSYILYRLLERKEPIERLICLAKENAAFIAAEDALYGTDPEHLRRWSEQIEYSTENMDILLRGLPLR